MDAMNTAKKLSQKERTLVLMVSDPRAAWLGRNTYGHPVGDGHGTMYGGMALRHSEVAVQLEERRQVRARPWEKGIWAVRARWKSPGQGLQLAVIGIRRDTVRVDEGDVMGAVCGVFVSHEGMLFFSPTYWHNS